MTAEVVDVEVIVTEAVTAGVTDPGLAPEVVGRDPAAVAAGTDLIHHLPADAGALPVSFLKFLTTKVTGKEHSHKLPSIY